MGQAKITLSAAYCLKYEASVQAKDFMFLILTVVRLINQTPAHKNYPYNFNYVRYFLVLRCCKNFTVYS